MDKVSFTNIKFRNHLHNLCTNATSNLLVSDRLACTSYRDAVQYLKGYKVSRSGRSTLAVYASLSSLTVCCSPSMGIQITECSPGKACFITVTS